MLSKFRKDFGVLIAGDTSAVRIDSDDQDDAISTMSEVCKKHSWEMRVFDIAVGVKWAVGDPPMKAEPSKLPTSKNPMDLLKAVGGDEPQQPTSIISALHSFWMEPSKPDPSTKGETRPVIMVVRNLHLGFESHKQPLVALVSHLVADKIRDHPNYSNLKKELYEPNEITEDATPGKFLIGLMPAEAKLPPEIDPLFFRLIHEIPDSEELGEILDGILPETATEEEDNENGLTIEDKKKVCKFALGLTRRQAEGVFSSSLVLHGRIVPEYIWQQKSSILNKEGLVELYQGTEKFKDIAGLEGAKSFLKSLLTPDPFDDADSDCRAKGVLFVGLPGTGKTLIAKAAGNELGFPTLMVNPGNWMGQYVGESESKTRKAFQILRAHAPCMAIVD